MSKLTGLSYNLKGHYHIHNSLQLGPVLRQADPVNILLFYILFNIIIFPPTLHYSKWLLPFRFFNKYSVWKCRLTHACYMRGEGWLHLRWKTSCLASALAYPPYLVDLSVSVTWERDPLNMAKLHLAENMRSVFTDIQLVNCFSNMPYPVWNNPHAWPGADVSSVTLECRQEWLSGSFYCTMPSVSAIMTARQFTVFIRTFVWSSL